MTGRLRWSCSRLQYKVAQQETLQLNYTLPIGCGTFFFFCTNELNKQKNFVSVLWCHSDRKMRCLFLIYLYYFLCKTPANGHWNMPVMNRKKTGAVLAVRNTIRLQDFSHMKAIDFSWKSWTFFGEEGQWVLFENKWRYEAGCVRQYLRRM